MQSSLLFCVASELMKIPKIVPLFWQLTKTVKPQQRWVAAQTCNGGQRTETEELRVQGRSELLKLTLERLGFCCFETSSHTSQAGFDLLEMILNFCSSFLRLTSAGKSTTMPASAVLETELCHCAFYQMTRVPATRPLRDCVVNRAHFVDALAAARFCNFEFCNFIFFSSGCVPRPV